MDKTLKCIDCREEFVLSESQVKFYEEKIAQDPKTWHMPKRCANCRIKKKQNRNEAGY